MPDECLDATWQPSPPLHRLEQFSLILIILSMTRASVIDAVADILLMQALRSPH